MDGETTHVKSTSAYLLFQEKNDQSTQVILSLKCEMGQVFNITFLGFWQRHNGSLSTVSSVHSQLENKYCISCHTSPYSGDIGYKCLLHLSWVLGMMHCMHRCHISLFSDTYKHKTTNTNLSTAVETGSGLLQTGDWPFSGWVSHSGWNLHPLNTEK